MNIEKTDESLLKEIKRVVENITAIGKLPNELEAIKEMYEVWNLAYKKNDRVTNCPSCRQTKFMQLKRTYDIYDLKSKFKKRKSPVKKKKK